MGVGPVRSGEEWPSDFPSTALKGKHNYVKFTQEFLL